MYRAFNARDIDGVLTELADDVDWPNAWEGGRVIGHSAISAYWTRQWGTIDPQVEPVRFTPLPDGTVEVEVHQVVRDMDGAVLSDATVTHTYAFRDDGRIGRMDVHEPQS